MTTLNDLDANLWFWLALYLALGWVISEVVVKWGERELSLSSIVFITLSWPILLPCAVIVTAFKKRKNRED